MDPIAVMSLVVGIVAAYYGKAALNAGKWTKSQDEFKAVRNYLKENRLDLINQVLNEGKYEKTIPDVPLLTKDEWIASKPLRLDKITLVKGESNSAEIGTDWLLEIKKILPFTKNGRRFSTYTDALIEIDKPEHLHNRKSFRIIDIQKNDDDYLMIFDRHTTTYFDYLNTGEALSYYTAKNSLQKSKNKNDLRKRLNPYDLNKRVVLPGICTLTIRKDRDNCTFYMLQRSRNKVATGMGNYHVIPAGEFQPSSRSIESEKEDFSIWKNIMREYNEEFLGAKDIYGDSGYSTDYDNEPYKSLELARLKGELNIFFLGFALDPLNLKGEIMTVCIFEAETFDKIFKDIIHDTDEGTLISGKKKNDKVHGIAFNEENIKTFLESDTIPAAMGCLRLAWHYRKELGIESHQYEFIRS